MWWTGFTSSWIKGCWVTGSPCTG
uniref:Uncharacterized protein n=1 Tax=Arundo donax TaxID=35708 RepID=A0A0A9C755_ARUDO